MTQASMIPQNLRWMQRLSCSKTCASSCPNEHDILQPQIPTSYLYLGRAVLWAIVMAALTALEAMGSSRAVLANIFNATMAIALAMAIQLAGMPRRWTVRHIQCAMGLAFLRVSVLQIQYAMGAMDPNLAGLANTLIAVDTGRSEIHHWTP